jgi:hypothetical protein
MRCPPERPALLHSRGSSDDGSQRNFDLKTWTDGKDHPEPKKGGNAALECLAGECRERGVAHLFDRAHA